MKPKKHYGLILIVLAVIAVLLIAQSNLQQATLLTAQQINIDSQGYESGGKVKGTFWSVMMSASMSDQVSFYEFDDSDVPTGTTWNGKNVEVKNRIKIEIDPARPYYERSIEKKNYVVAPRAYRNWINTVFGTQGRDQYNWRVGALMSDVYETSTSTWELHTPFTLRVYKNGDLVGETQMDLFQSGIAPYQNVALDGKDVKIGDTTNYVMFESLGALLGGYESPNWASVIGWSNQYLYLNSPDVQKAMHNPYPYGDGVTAATGNLGAPSNYEGTYAWYWYGCMAGGNTFNWYWKDDGTPCPYIYPPNYQIIQDSQNVPGWKTDPNSAAGYMRAVPRQAYKFPTGQPPETQQYYSLTEYLEAVVRAQKISTWSGLLPSWHPSSIQIQIDEPPGKLRLYLPYNAYNPLFVIRISTELADTVIWEPPVANIKIVDVNGDTSTTADEVIDLGTTGDIKPVSVKLRNEGDIRASGTVGIQPIDQNVSWAFEPQAWGTGPMNPNEEKTFTFNVVDLTTTETTTAEFRLTVTNVLGGITDSRVLKITLLPKGVGGVTLYIRAIDKNTTLDVAGIKGVVTYNDQIQAEEIIIPATLDFEGATPYVTVTSFETEKYKAASDSKQLEVGLNTITLKLEPTGYEEEGTDWTLLWIILVAVAVFVLALMFSKKRGKLGKTKRKSGKFKIRRSKK